MASALQPEATRVVPVFVEAGEARAGHYDGALVIKRTYQGDHNMTCQACLSGSQAAPEPTPPRSDLQPAFGKMKLVISRRIVRDANKTTPALRLIPDPVLPVAEKVLEFEFEGTLDYAGSIPGTTSLMGFAQELSYWKLSFSGENLDGEPIWRRSLPKPPQTAKTILKRWTSLVKHGLGENWTEQKGYDSVRKICGPSE